jgi:hypothetical protein
LSATNTCDDTLSREHLISESVLKVLADKQVQVSGLPWLNGQSKVLSFPSLVSRCLCTRHNSVLSPIDTAGANLFRAIQTCGTTVSGRRQQFLLSGHDVERWMLRTLAALGTSGNFAIDGAVIDPSFVDRLRIVELLEKPAFWKEPLGVYLLRGPRHQFKQREDVQLAPIIEKNGAGIVGITLNIQGLEFALLASEHDVRGTGLDKAIYRPDALEFNMAGLRHRIQLSWEDATPHQDVLITWQRQDPLASVHGPFDPLVPKKAAIT